MRLSVFRENDKVLLVGEGNFSFAVSLVKHNLSIAITASCYESSITQTFARTNIEFLEAHGIRSLLGVDGTRLAQHPIIGAERFDKIIFNFPHVGGKMRIEKNRELLMKFFESAANLLEKDGFILMTLCNGQGGTIADCPRRRWDDSWKVAEMAAYSNFLLIGVEPFCVSNFLDYRSTGYRSLDKKFNIESSLTHFFKSVEPPSSADLAPTIKVDSRKLSTEFQEITYRDIAPAVSIVANPLCLYNFDTTFLVAPDFKETELYAVLHNFAGQIVRNVEFVRSYRFPSTDRVTRTYRISYGSNSLPLHRKRLIDIHENVITKILEDNMNVVVTR